MNNKSSLPDDNGMPERNIKISAFILLGVFLVSYFLSSFLDAPYLWGINQLAFLNLWTRLTLLAVALLLAFPAFSVLYLGGLERLLVRISSTKARLAMISILAGGFGVFVFYHWKISPDLYGDAYGVVSWLSRQRHSFTELLDIKNFEPLSQLIHQSIAFGLRADQRVVIQIVSAVCGGLFILNTLLFVGFQDSAPAWKVLAVVLLLTAGANQLFFGHVEDYTLAYLCVCLFLTCGWLFFDGRKTLGPMFILLLVGSRLHAEMLLLIPAFIYLLLFRFKSKYPFLQSLLQPRRIILFVVFTVMCATLAYFFYFDAYHLRGIDPAAIRTEAKSKMFLQIINPLPPPHHYTLFSLSHISDVVQEFALTVSPATCIILALCLICYRKIKWNEPRLVFFGIGLFYFQLFNFTINPMLSMPWDWDLLSLAAGPTTFFGLALSWQLYRAFPKTSLQRIVLGILIAPTVLSGTIFYINSNRDLILRRLENIGEWAYRSYFWETNYIINITENAIPDPSEQIARRDAMIRRLLPYKSPPDLQIGNLYLRVGEAYFRNADFTMAAQRLIQSSEIDWTNAAPFKILALANLLQWKLDEADKSISFYNANVNFPEVKDFSGLMIAHYTNFIKLLDDSRTDSSIIRRELHDIFLQAR